MSQEHVWSCGQCGTRVGATVGAIARAFNAHLLTCPARARRRTSPAARLRDRAPRTRRAGRVNAEAPQRLREG
jgi:hypothetical protein